MGSMELMIRMAPLWGGMGSVGLGGLVGSRGESERMKCPATRDLAWVSEWYDASLWMDRTMPLAWKRTVAFGCVEQ